MTIANLLVGNAPEAAALEYAGSDRCAFTRHCWFALTGAACEATLDGAPVWLGWRMEAKAGQRLVLKNPQHGIRSYLAVAGGIDVPEVLGSRSTDLKVGIGGIEGRRLQDGDQVKIGKSSRRFSASRGVKQLPIGNIIRALPGPEYHEFDSVSQESFWRSPWKLSPQSNRMGYRLQGSRSSAQPTGKCFHGLLPGVVQVPHNGQPIVLMNDAQTTGGYPRIACILKPICTNWRKFR